MKYLLFVLLALGIMNVSAVKNSPTFQKSNSLAVVKVSSEPGLGEIVRALCLVESDNRAHLKGRSGERGVMQIMRNEWEFATHKLMGADKNNLIDGVDYSWSSAFNRDKNIAVGTVYMNYLIDKYYGDWRTAVKVYHSGHRGVFKLGRGNSYLNMVKRTLASGNTAWRKARKDRKA